MAEIIAEMEQPRVVSSRDVRLINTWADKHHEAKSIDPGWVSGSLDKDGKHILIPFEREPGSEFVRCLALLKVKENEKPEEVWLDVLESDLKNLLTAVEVRNSGLTDRLEG